MLVSYYERKILIISLLVIIIDGVLIYYNPSYFNNIGYLYPMLTVSLIPFISINNKKKYYFYGIFLGIVYDLLYSNIFLYNVILFILLIRIDKLIIKYYKSSLFLFIISAILNIVIYDFISFLLIMLTNYQVVNINDLLYKISHSLILNILSVFVYWFLCKKSIKYA